MFRLPAASFLLLCSVSLSDAAIAEEASRSAISPLVTLGKLAVALLLVLLVFWFFARIMQQIQGTRGTLHSGLKVVGTLPLGQRERVVVVQAGDEQLLLGVTANQVNTLHVLSQPLNGPESEELGDFRQKLSAALKRQVAG